MRMRATSPSRNLKYVVRGRRLLSVKQKKSNPPSTPIRPKPDIMESPELDASFKACAYPSAVEIFRLSEHLELPASKIKSEFQKRRQDFRLRHKLNEDTVITVNSAFPRIFIFLNILYSHLISMPQTLTQVAVFFFAISSLWYSMYSQIGNLNYHQELIHHI